VAIYRHAHPNYSKPWFKGEQVVQTCKIPYYGTDGCYFLSASSDGTNILNVSFSNGGYLSPTDTECVAIVPDNDINTSKRACQITDQDGNRWDLMPQQTAK